LRMNGPAVPSFPSIAIRYTVPAPTGKVA
jgi:hypothetical protein